MCNSLVMCSVALWIAGLGEDSGPRLGERDFFNGLDLELPGLKQVKEAAEKEDWTAAKSAGQTHAFLYADRGGLKRRYGQFETEAAVEFMKLAPDGKSIGAFRYLP